MKRLFSVVLMLGSLAIAQPPVSIQAPAMDREATIKLLTSGGPGAYNFFQYDKTEIQKQFYTQVFQQRKVDYDYFLSTVKAIEKSFNELLRENVYDKEAGLQGMSIRSVQNVKYISSEEFLTAINRYQQARLALDAQIATLTAIADGMVPSAEEIAADESGIKKNVPNYGKQNFEPIKKFYADRLNLIETFLSNLPYNITLPGNIPHIIKSGSGKGLVLEAEIMRMTPQQVLALKKEILGLRIWGEDAQTNIDDYTRFLQNRVYEFNKTYGNTERFRVLGEVERKKREEEAKLIMVSFWSRSYLRAVYGMPLGAIGATYDKKWLHFDAFKTSTEALLNLMEQPVTDANSMVRIEQNYRNLLRRADVRSEKILDGNLGFIAAGENLLTFLGGKRNEAQSAQMMLRLLAADLYEERLLLELGDLQQMKERYRQRYYATEEDEVFYRKAQMAYDRSIDAKAITEIYTEKDRTEMIKKILGEDSDAFGQAGFGTGENLRTKYASVINHMETKQEELLLAEQKEAAIANATNPNNKFRAAVETRKRRL